jgi:hypothetical protein
LFRIPPPLLSALHGCSSLHCRAAAALADGGRRQFSSAQLSQSIRLRQSIVRTDASCLL